MGWPRCEPDGNEENIPSHGDLGELIVENEDLAEVYLHPSKFDVSEAFCIFANGLFGL